MKPFFTAVSLGVLLALMGCSGGSSGAPAAAAQHPKATMTAQATDAANAIWNAYMDAMQKQWDHFGEEFGALKDRAAKAEGQAKADLEKKLAEAKVKLDAVAVKMAEMKSAGTGHWAKATEGLSKAFEDLKKILA